MATRTSAIMLVAVISCALPWMGGLWAQNLSAAPPLVASHSPEVMPAQEQNALVRSACATCHNDRTRAGGLSLAAFDAANLVEHAEVAEKMIRKLRAGMMPPATVRNRPDSATLARLAVSLEAPLDGAAAIRPNPGRRDFQRLNRAEYVRAVRDLLNLETDVSALLPPDTVSHGFDNIAAEQGFSPMLMQSYLAAATKLSTLALGDPGAMPGEATYRIPRTASQMLHVPGAPIGTRGGISVVHTFPADGEYSFRILLHAVPTGELFGSVVRGEEIDVSINGERVALLPVDHRLTETSENGLNLTTSPIRVNAGPQRVSAAFVQRFESPVDDLVAPHDHTLADTIYGSDVGLTALPHMRDLAITGPMNVTGVASTPSRERVLICTPRSPRDEPGCAYRILRRLASQAYRQPEATVNVEPLMTFYRRGYDEGGFEMGIRRGLQAILASPRFLFRLEEMPAGVRPGESYRIGDLELASRLSFFLWAGPPDDELLDVAAASRLRHLGVLEQQVRRMLADPRAESLSTRFAAQWLRLGDIDHVAPDAVRFPSYNFQLREAYKRETELLFDSIVREDRSVLDLFDAAYTFINERIAKQYGIPGVVGNAFRRVPLGPELDYRRGIFGHGSIQVLTSVPDRTSPVLRGKWVMEVLLGTPPPPPPPNVPALEDSASAVTGGKPLSVRQRMEQHRKSPACASCHRVIDPLGLTLENFDVTGAWRIKDNGVDIDATGELYDGTTMNGPGGLRAALLARSDVLLRNFTENLMTYALGRRVEYFDQPAIRAIVRAAAERENRFSRFVIGVVNSPAFQMNRVQTTENAANQE